LLIPYLFVLCIDLFMSYTNISIYQAHPFHLVSPSPWPINTSIALFLLTSSSALSMHGFNYTGILFFIGLILVNYTLALWFRDVIAEGTYKGNHTIAVQKGIAIGIALFIVSEIFFFLAVFWAHFHSSLSPDVEVGAEWPPMGIQAIDPFELPLLNTIILLSSGLTVTYGHHCLIQGNRAGAIYGLTYTILLAILFTILQGVEYSVSSFTISDGIFGSCFYFATGLHGIHVIIGTILLSYSWGRTLAYHVSTNHHLGLESGIFYWHFVDIVWLFLYVSIYYYGS
jgi:cytochrome c oxidase subunit 3